MEVNADNKDTKQLSDKLSVNVEIGSSYTNGNNISNEKCYEIKQQLQENVKFKEINKGSFNKSQKRVHLPQNEISEIIFDDENPLELDYQGIDYKEMVERIEQNFQNRQEYLQQKMHFEKCQNKLRKDFQIEENIRFNEYKLPEYYELQTLIDTNENNNSTIIKSSPLTIENRPTISRPVQEAIPFVPEPTILVKLIRTTDKPENIYKKSVSLEHQNDRIFNMKKKKLEKLKSEKTKSDELEMISKENFIENLCEQDFQQYFTNNLEIINEKLSLLPTVYEKQNNPHTLRETNYLKYLMNKSKRQTCEEEKVKNEFFNINHENKNWCTDLKSNNDDDIKSLPSDLSTDDEDTKSVGQKTDSKYQLRGFHYKLDTEIRGRNEVKPKLTVDRPPRTCIPRTEWFNQLTVTTSGFTKNKISKTASPNDDDYYIFVPEQYNINPVTASPIHDFIKNKHLNDNVIINDQLSKIRKPKIRKIKKFNLTAYLYGKSEKIKNIDKSQCVDKINDEENIKSDEVPKEILDKINKQFRQQQNRDKVMNQNRLRALRVSSVELKKLQAQEPQVDESDEPECQESDENSSDSDWIPEQMELNKNQNIVRKSKREFQTPRLMKLASDIIIAPNLHIKKTNITEKFKARYHHSHKDKSQHKTVFVKYQPKLRDQKCAKEVDTINEVNDDINVQDYQIKNSLNDNPNNDLETSNEQNSKCLSDCKVSVDEKSAFLKIIQEQNNKAKLNLVQDEPKLSINKDEYIKQIKVEMDSINSCNSSEISSIHTNESKDNGSFFEFHGKTVPCSYITKPWLPFEEQNRCYITAEILKTHDEYTAPYNYVPFSGQQIDMCKLTKPKDKFYTCSTRSRYDIRDRLKVDIPNIKKTKIGVKNKKFISQLATDWDENYQNVIRTRANSYTYKPRTSMAIIRNTLRMKYHSFCIQEAINDNDVLEKKRQKYAKDVENFRDTANTVFMQWEETYYRKFLAKSQQLKPYLDENDKQKSHLTDIRNKFTKLEMEIISSEGILRSRTIYQNFHYLLMDIDWRQPYDWIHKNDDGELESYHDSIKNRLEVNLRKRENETAYDVFAIKEFYDEYLNSEKGTNILYPFESVNKFMSGLSKLRLKSFVCLLNLHSTMWILANVEHGYNLFQNWSNIYISQRNRFLQGKCKSKYFIENLTNQLQLQSKYLIDKKLEISESDKLYRTSIALCDTLFIKLIPATVRESMKLETSVLDKMRLISNLVIDLLGKLDRIPKNIRIKCETKLRQRRSFLERQAISAVFTQKRIISTIEQMKQNLAKPPKRIPRTGKLPRSYLSKKKYSQKINEKSKINNNNLTDMDKQLMRMFTDDNNYDDETAVSFDKTIDLTVFKSLATNCIPFYFDCFLNQCGYFPKYDFETEIQLKEGDEFKRFKYIDVIDSVIKSLSSWEKHKKTQMDEHIKRTWLLYTNS